MEMARWIVIMALFGRLFDFPLCQANLPDSKWELVLPNAPHSIRSLLSTSNNTTPHERSFSFQRRSSLGTSLSSWLQHPGPVLLRRFVRTSKNDPFVDQVELTDANPTYAHVKYPDGREPSASLWDLTPCPLPPGQEGLPSERKENDIAPDVTVPDLQQDSTASPMASDEQQNSSTQVPTIRRSTRQVKPSSRYGW